MLQFERGGIQSADDLWRKVGKDSERGIDKVARATGIKRDRLIEILTDCCLQESEPGAVRWLEWSSRHTLDLVVILAVLLTLTLYLRAQGWLSALPAPWGLRQMVPVAARHLREGQVLRSRDLVEAWLNPGSDQFQDRAGLEGLRLARDLPAGSAVRFPDALREQTVALRDLPLHSLVAQDAVGTRWSAYDPDAMLDARQVIGRRLLHAVRKGEVISTLDVTALKRSARRRSR